METEVPALCYTHRHPQRASDAETAAAREQTLEGSRHWGCNGADTGDAREQRQRMQGSRHSGCKGADTWDVKHL